jgi:hypothetical protein
MSKEPSAWPETRGFRILNLTHGLGSNNGDLIHDPVHFEAGEIYTQITNWEKLEYIQYVPDMDSYCHLLDDKALPFDIKTRGNELFIQGDLSRLQNESQDHRLDILGNIGIWFRWVLVAQEKAGIYSLHASSIYKPNKNELIIIIGKAGAGKTVFLLESIARGYQIFSTEMTYFQLIPHGVSFYRGALMDNIRLGSFLYDFPEASERLRLDLPEVDNPWEYKLSVSMHSVTTDRSELINPSISFVFPRVESGIEHSTVKEINSQRILAKMIFDSASEKIGATILLHEELPVVGLDTPTLAQKRLETARMLVAAPKWKIKQAKTTLTGPKSCMEGIDE